MVREGGQKSGEEVEKDGAAGRVGESHHDAECQHEMLNNTQVTTHTAELSGSSRPAHSELRRRPPSASAGFVDR